jgi:phosphoenolpyruvate synthase/pyruvate phosphate dikinase
MSLTNFLSEPIELNVGGGKASNLSKLTIAKLNVPPGFVSFADLQ